MGKGKCSLFAEFGGVIGEQVDYDVARRGFEEDTHGFYLASRGLGGCKLRVLDKGLGRGYGDQKRAETKESRVCNFIVVSPLVKFNAGGFCCG